MTADWTIEEGDAGCGKVIHTAAPRFTARHLASRASYRFSSRTTQSP